ncbi:unnamed protein product [Brugia timori]|uniref:7TM_GPCR_Srx domain-containing protein n=1 Tax=Brugia timori TaxID=42155 RepID=A0A158PT53_9BILA|nr:unnamed protein product [Brugia timori]
MRRLTSSMSNINVTIICFLGWITGFDGTIICICHRCLIECIG